MNKLDLQNEILSALDVEDLPLLYDLLEDYESQFSYDSFYYLSYSDGLILLQDYEEILALMDEAMDYGFVNSLIYERKADAFYALSDYQSALDLYLKCDFEKDEQDSLHLLFMIGLCYKQLACYEEAIPFFEDILLEEESNIHTLLNCAFCYLEIGKNQRGCEYLDRVLCLDSSFLSDICEFLCPFEDDLFFAYTNRIKDLDVKDEMICQHYFIKEDYAKAIPYWKGFTERHPYIHNLDYLAQLYDLNHNLKEAQACYQSILAKNNMDDSFYSIKAVLNAYHYLKRKDYSSFVQKNWSLVESYPPIYLLFLDYLIKMQDRIFLPRLFLLDCVSSFNDYQQKEYKRLRVSYYLLKDEYKEAIQYLLSFSPNELDHYYRSLVLAYFYQGDYQAVLDTYQNGMPNGLIAYMAYMSYISMGKFKEADQLFLSFTSEISQGIEIEEADIFLHFVDDLLSNQKKEEL